MKSDSPVISIQSYDNFNQVTYLNNGRRQDILCKNLIICAGAIECTKLSLLINKKLSCLRTGFSDHLSAPFGYLSDCDLNKLNSFSSFEFLNGQTMRNWRFEMSSESILREKLPPHNIHLSFINKIDDKILDGFNSIRLILQSVQKRKMPSLSHILALIKNIDWLVKMAWFRIFKKRLLRPKNSRPEFHLVIQQEVSENNYIKLSETKTDHLGNPAVEINWSMTKLDEKNILNVINEFELFWIENFESKFGKLRLYDIPKTVNNFENCGGVYHPTSSLAFGENKNYPINKDLYLKSAKNIQFISTACLPTGGGVNPTMMALLLAARLVDQHANNPL